MRRFWDLGAIEPFVTFFAVSSDIFGFWDRFYRKLFLQMNPIITSSIGADNSLDGKFVFSSWISEMSKSNSCLCRQSILAIIVELKIPFATIVFVFNWNRLQFNNSAVIDFRAKMENEKQKWKIAKIANHNVFCLLRQHQMKCQSCRQSVTDQECRKVCVSACNFIAPPA